MKKPTMQTFQMGDNLDGTARSMPVHTVRLSPFSMSATEVNLAEWKEVLAWASAHGYKIPKGATGKGPKYPVTNVTWYSAVLWCNARSEMCGLRPCYYTDAKHTKVYRSGKVDITPAMVDWTADGYRLPTEAEWECAARCGNHGLRFPWGDTISHSQANYYASPIHFVWDRESKPGTNPKAGKVNPRTLPCGWGPTHDFAGNVEEWVWDWYGPYTTESAADPRGPSKGIYRVRRGGSWLSKANRCTVYARNPVRPGSANSEVGFRVCQTA